MDRFVPGGDAPSDDALVEEIRDEKTVYEGLIFDVNRLSVTLPNGCDAERDVVRHPGAVAVIAVTDDARVCLVRQYRSALDRVTVEIPAGKLDPGEDPLDAARRELAEETGLEARSMALLVTIATSVGFSDERIGIYLATALTRGPNHPDPDEFLGVDFVPIEDFVDAVLDGLVEDAKTVVGALALDAVSRRLLPNDEERVGDALRGEGSPSV